MEFKARALHYVFKIANREASYKFYTEILGMKVLRHEEFEEGCKATCNGPYDNMWSKTMIGYGSEDEHFVLELTYNYPVHEYKLGNDFNGIHIESDEVLRRVLSDAPEKFPDGSCMVKDPDGHPFYIKGGTSAFPVKKVSLNVADMSKSKEFWARFLGITVEEDSPDEEKCLLSYGPNQCKLELCSLKGERLERGTAFGRIAFATPTEFLKTLENIVGAEDKNFIQQPLVSLDTPGKATVHVVILRDPNEHEICFVGDEGFRELSKVDPNADEALREAIRKDESEKWL